MDAVLQALRPLTFPTTPRRASSLAAGPMPTSSPYPGGPSLGPLGLGSEEDGVRENSVQVQRGGVQ